MLILTSLRGFEELNKGNKLFILQSERDFFCFIPQSLETTLQILINRKWPISITTQISTSEKNGAGTWIIMRISESMPGKRINRPLSDFNLFVLFQCPVRVLYPLRLHEWREASLEGREELCVSPRHPVNFWPKYR